MKKLILLGLFAPSIYAAPLAPLLKSVAPHASKAALVVTWEKQGADKVNFKVERDGKEVGTRGDTATSMEDFTGPGSYTYRLRAVDVKTKELSPYSNELTGTLGTTPKPPKPPKDPAPPSGPAAALKTALAAARPGDTIALQPGVYRGKFVITVSGTPDKPITLTGPKDAILDGENPKAGYVLHLDGASYWRIKGITVTNGQKGIMTDAASYNEITDVTVHSVGMEAVHFRRKSTHNVLQASTIYNTGLVKPEYAECVYVGTAGSNAADHSDYNQILNNRLGPNCRAEAIDIKEMTSHGTIEGNTVDGTGESGKNYSVSGIFIKGNDYMVRGNTVRNSHTEAFRVNVVTKGWGNRNTFDGNHAFDVPGYGFNIVKGEGNRVLCNNVAVNAKLGLSNVACTK